MSQKRRKNKKRVVRTWKLCRLVLSTAVFLTLARQSPSQINITGDDLPRHCSNANTARLVRAIEYEKVVHVFALGKPEIFTQSSLLPFFKCLDLHYNKFYTLSVTLFSDEKILAKAIDNKDHPLPDIDPPIDSSKYDCANPEKAMRPCPFGYYRALYFRTGNRRYISFSKDPSQEHMTDIKVLKSFQKRTRETKRKGFP